MAKYKKRNNRNNRVFANRSIKAKQVRCIDHNNENIGILSTYKAIEMAENVGLDLVQISNQGDQIPTCKIVDYGKYKYNLTKRNKERAKKQRESVVKTKEVKFRPSTSENDLRTKAKRASQFIEEGCRVKVAIQFKGREMAHKEVGQYRFAEFFDMLEGDIHLLNEPSMEGRTMVAFLTAGKDHKSVEKAS